MRSCQTKPFTVHQTGLGPERELAKGAELDPNTAAAGLGVGGLKHAVQQQAGEIADKTATEVTRQAITQAAGIVGGKVAHLLGDGVTGVGEYLARKAPRSVSPGVRMLEGQYVNDRGQVQPWRAYYDEYGRRVARTDYSAGNKTAGIPDTHHHTWDPKTGRNVADHVEGEYKP